MIYQSNTFTENSKLVKDVNMLAQAVPAKLVSSNMTFRQIKSFKVYTKLHLYLKVKMS